MSLVGNETNQATTVAQVESLLKIQANLIDQMTKFIINTRKREISKRTHSYYIARINGWHDLWQRFATNESTLSQIISPNDLERSYFKEDVFQKQEEVYYNFKGDLVELASKYETPSISQDPGPSRAGPSESVSLGQSNLPRITLPKFSGDYNDWVSFRDLYLALIHNNSNLEDVQKFHYLKSSLNKEAANVIKQYSMTQANYASAWKSLTERYENKRILVSSLLKTFTSYPRISTESAQALKGIVDVTSECIVALSNLNINTDHWDPLIIHIVIQKLPTETHKEWELSIGDSNDLPTWQDFKKFLELRFRTLEAISGSKPKQGSNEHKRTEHNQKVNVQNYHASSSICKMCQENHPMRSCPQFLGLEPSGRLKTARAKGVCINCLGSYHTAKKCLSGARCAQCKAKHHTLLHLVFNKRQEGGNVPAGPRVGTNQDASEVKVTTPTASTLFLSESRQVLLATALVYVDTAHGLHLARALIDPGSQITFLTTSLCQRLGLRMKNTSINITGLANSKAASSHQMAKLRLKSRYNDQIVEATAVALDTLTNLLPSRTLSKGSWDHLKNLQLADPTFNEPNRVDILIGADIYPFIIKEGIKTGPVGTPMGQETIFGWILLGQVSTHPSKTSHIDAVSLMNTADLNSNLKRFWEIEEPITTISKNPEDILCEQFFQTTHRRNPDGSYLVRLPFRPNPEIWLGPSRNVAMKRFLSTERNIRIKGLTEAYCSVIQEYKELNQMEEINPSEKVLIDKYTSNYLPHHAVLKESSTTTKLRVVFDASCKTSSGASLNQLVMTGPALQRDLMAVILKWRFHRYAFTADIEKMYRCIWVHPDDVDYQRILWRPSEDQPVKDYRLLTVTFGVACAPYLAIRTLQQLAADEKSQFPHASECLLNDFYVDDVLTGHSSIDGAANLRRNLTLLLERGGFHLRKFSANHPDVLRDVHPDDVTRESLQLFDDHSTIKALGISWSPKADDFRYQLNADFAQVPTKRTILSNIARLFDPLGWISPVIVIGKILMQKLWLLGVGWDTPLPEDLSQQWIGFISDLKAIEQVRIPRWLGYLNDVHLEYHGFCDSSERAYAAVIYTRVVAPEGEVSTHLMVSKTRVAPVKTISLPRLELCGAHLLSRLIAGVRGSFREPEQIHLWTDSTVVLAWLSDHPNRWKTFVGNRVADIHMNTEGCHWHHVPSKQNPADLASRGILASEISESQLWWTGPPWLKKDPNQWPRFIHL